MRLVHEQPVYAQLFKRHHIVLAALGLQLFQPRFQRLFRAFQLHIADLGSVVVQALHDELDVGAIQLQEPGAHHLMGEVRPGNSGDLASGADRFHNQLRSLDNFIHWNLAFALAKLHVNVDITIWFFVG